MAKVIQCGAVVPGCKRGKRVFRVTGRDHGKLEALRQGGVDYIIINFGGSRENIRRFARDIMPAFAEPAFALAGK